MDAFETMKASMAGDRVDWTDPGFLERCACGEDVVIANRPGATIRLRCSYCGDWMFGVAFDSGGRTFPLHPWIWEFEVLYGISPFAGQ